MLLVVSIGATAPVAADGASRDLDARVAHDLARARSLVAGGRARAALAVLEALERRAPGRLDVMTSHLELLRALRPPDRRMGSLLRACEGTIEGAAREVCARASTLAGDFDRALALASTPSRYDPRASGLLAEIGAVAHAAGREDVHALAVERAYALAPDDPDRVRDAAVLRLLAGRPTAASGLLEPLLVARPDDDVVRALAAEAALLAGEHDRAIAHYTARLARCRPEGRSGCLADLATAQLYAGRLASAITTAEEAATLACPDDPRPHRVLGMAFVRAGREDDARAAFEASLARREDPVTAAMLRALGPR